MRRLTTDCWEIVTGSVNIVPVVMVVVLALIVLNPIGIWS